MADVKENETANKTVEDQPKSNDDKVVQMADEGKHLQDMMALIDKQEKSSEIANLNNQPVFLTINKGKRNEYTLEVMFPGVKRASRLRDESRNGFGGIDQTYFMENVALKELIVRPKIYSLDWFGRRGGYDDAFNKIYDWFDKSLNGEPYDPED